MKNSVFARPNLKLFLLGAIVIAVVHNAVVLGLPEVSVLTARAAGPSERAMTERHLQQLLAQATQKPGSEVYMQISRSYETLGDLKNAVHYLRRAQKFADAEDAVE
jgi:hypothetical protein